ncbi:MAG: hypothetical protein HGGPFJEG_00115 [Ignavibacteria bacterium]|nr:hypothetical protein [Ignavibacteria bacterium]
MKFVLFIKILILTSLLLSGCSESDDSIQNPGGGGSSMQLIKIDSGYAAGSKAIVSLYRDQALKTGYNKIYAALYDSVTGAVITNADVTLLPLMDMGSMVHSAPLENPDNTLLENKWFDGAIIFIMPSDSLLKWKIEVHVRNLSAAGNPEGIAYFGSIDVMNDDKKYKTFNASSGSRIYLSYIKPNSPVVGINDFEYTIHKKSSMMDYPPDDSFICEVYPWMPSMGHGSPNNVNPVSIGNGHYNGDVNFTMTGDWQLKVYIQKNGIKDSTYFELDF